MDFREIIENLRIDQLFKVLVLVVVGLWVLKWITAFLDRIAERFSNWRMASKRFSVITQFTVYLVLFVAVTSNLVSTQNKETLYAVLGALGLAVGFAFKDLLASIVAGIVLLVDEPFRVGDQVEFEDHFGEITKIGLRSVRLVKLDSSEVTIPNAKFLTEAVRSTTHGNLHAMLVIPFYIAPSDDFITAQRIVTEAAWTSRFAYTKNPIVTLLNEKIVESQMVTVIRVKAWVYDHRVDGRFITDVTERVKLAFAEAGIRGPRDLYLAPAD